MPTVHLDCPPILLIDDHALFRTGLGLVLRASLQDLPLLEAGSLEEALQHKVDALSAVLADVQLPGLNGIEGIALLKRRWPMAPVIVLSSSADSQTVASAMARGAAAYVSKADSAVDIVQVVERVLQGQSPDFDRHIPQTGAGTPEAPHLTPRQCEVLELLCEGLPNKAIGRRLGVSENTVRGHVQAIFAFLKVASRTEAVIKARRGGLVRE